MLEVAAEGAVIGLADGSRAELPLAGMTWARAASGTEQLGPEVTAADQVVQPGDVVWVAPAAPASEAGGEAPRYALQQSPEVEGAVVALDPHNGRVLAMSGGFSYARSVFNRATQALRQPGSALKPFIYLAGLESGFTPSSILLDAPIVVDQGPGLGKWKPANYSGRFYGPSTLRLGIEKSRNLMTVRLAQAAGMDRVVDMVDRFGIARGMGRNLASALGAGEVDLLGLTTAYATLVNGGKRIQPALIERIQDRHGRTVVRRDDRPCPACQEVAWEEQSAPLLIDQREQVIPAPRAYQMVNLLEGVIERGTGARARAIGKPIAGKTGTSERQPRRLVPRIHAGPRGRRVHRLRPAEEPWRAGAGCERGAAGVHRHHDRGAGRPAGDPVPRPGRRAAGPGRCRDRPAAGARYRHRDPRGVHARDRADRGQPPAGRDRQHPRCPRIRGPPRPAARRAARRRPAGSIERGKGRRPPFPAPSLAARRSCYTRPRSR